ncbi:hypothetical protein LO762_14070 [Actinocorallia sp. API 0066]|uniref:hypothetical protein n=1 Tax=Actinocorallia sp. API 0066 TaxID=2896846 RepID=UPI001E3D5380|nr:hypothetical protein [Actinocorallia sp. API 0066]MCD0450309.1 hypothetical protein [Actinocorallia sp. API 0066]
MSGPDDSRPEGRALPTESGLAKSPAAARTLPSGPATDEGPPASPWWAPVIPPADPVDPVDPVDQVLAAPVREPESSGEFLTGTIVPKGPEIPPAEATITGEPRWAAEPPPPARTPPGPVGPSASSDSVVHLAARRDPPPPPPPPAEPPAPEPPSSHRAPRRRGRLPLYLALALVPAIAVATLAAVVLMKPGTPVPAVVPSPPAAVTTPVPSSTPTGPGATGVPAVDAAATDPRPLSVSEIFPERRITLDGRIFTADRRSLNLRCDYAATGAMSRALIRNDCQAVVRTTFVSDDGRTGVTVGVVAMPTKRIAITVQKSGSPPRRGQWFVGLPGKRTKAISEPGGYAAATTYGRYILYVYVRQLEGRKPAKGDRTQARLGTAFIGYVSAPLRQR